MFTACDCIPCSRVPVAGGYGGLQGENAMQGIAVLFTASLAFAGISTVLLLIEKTRPGNSELAR